MQITTELTYTRATAKGLEQDYEFPYLVRN